MVSENVGTDPYLGILHVHCSIRGTSDKSVAHEMKSPDASFVAFQLLKSLPRAYIVYLDG